jgi:hypothetical protein
MSHLVYQFIRAPFFSPRGFTTRALLLGVLFAFCELIGWREHTTFISGTATSAEIGINSSVMLGVIYLLAYFGCVLVAPALLLAAAILSAWQRILDPQIERQHHDTKPEPLTHRV